MARRRATEQDKQYERDKAFFVTMWKLVEKRLPQLAAFPESTNPVQNLERLEKGSRSLARKGLQQAIGDLLDMSRHWSSAEVAEADAELRSQKLPGLSEMRRHVWKWIPKILSREHIRNDEEYYLLKSTLDDLESGLSAAERKRAGRLLLDYEMQHQ